MMVEVLLVNVLKLCTHSRLQTCGQVVLKASRLRHFRGSGKCGTNELNQLFAKAISAEKEESHSLRETSACSVLYHHPDIAAQEHVSGEKMVAGSIQEAASEITACRTASSSASSSDSWQSNDQTVVVEAYSGDHMSCAMDGLASTPRDADCMQNDIASVEQSSQSTATPQEESRSRRERTPPRKKRMEPMYALSPVLEKRIRLGNDKLLAVAPAGTEEGFCPISCKLTVQCWKGGRIKDMKAKGDSKKHTIAITQSSGSTKLETGGLANNLIADIRNVRQIHPSKEDPQRALLVIETWLTAVYVTVSEADPTQLRRLITDIQDNFV